MGKSGDYAYKKLSKDKGMIILQGYDGPDAPNLHILLHFTTPDSGMAVYTDGEEKLIGNVMFMLETDKPHLRKKELPEVNSLLFPDLEDSSQVSSNPPQSIVGKTLQFSADHIQYHLTEGKTGRGPRPSSVPERTYAPRDAETAAPVAPKRTERVDDFADFSFGKIEL